MNPLAKLSEATAALAEAKTFTEIKAIRDLSEQALLYAQANKLGLDAMNEAIEVRLRAERKMGEVLILAKETGEIKQGGNGSNQHEQRFPKETIALSDVGISKKQSHVTQRLASLPEEVFKQRIEAAKVAQERLTTAKVLVPHVAHNSGQNEWYTPAEYIKAARLVMGGIDLDPASSDVANRVVYADKIYTVDDDGLEQHWMGKVWMNPPYSSALIGRFTEKLCAHYVSQDVTEAIVLVNNATETEWFQRMAQVATCICFPQRRVKFWKPDGETGAPLQGQAILYFGNKKNCFILAFRSFGFVGVIQEATLDAS